MNTQQILLNQIKQNLDEKFKGDSSEIISLIEECDFSSSFEEECDLFEAEYLYESLRTIDKVVPLVADLGGVSLHFKHSYDVDTKKYYFKSYATFDNGQYGKDVSEITDIDAEDPFDITTTKLMYECEDLLLADHPTFLEMLEERTNQSFDDSGEVEDVLAEFEDSSDEESYVEFNNAIVDCSKALVRSLGVLDLLNDLSDFVIEFTIEL